MHVVSAHEKPNYKYLLIFAIMIIRIPRKTLARIGITRSGGDNIPTTVAVTSALVSSLSIDIEIVRKARPLHLHETEEERAFE